MATPIKTGAHVYFEEYGYFMIGDMFQINSLYILRANNEVSTTPIRENLHFQVFNELHNFKGEEHSVIICGGVMAHGGYEGMKAEKVLPHVNMAKKTPV
jgi:hypothetical protein